MNDEEKLILAATFGDIEVIRGLISVSDPRAK